MPGPSIVLYRQPTELTTATISITVTQSVLGWKAIARDRETDDVIIAETGLYPTEQQAFAACRDDVLQFLHPVN